MQILEEPLSFPHFIKIVELVKLFESILSIELDELLPGADVGCPSKMASPGWIFKFFLANSCPPTE